MTNNDSAEPQESCNYMVEQPDTILRPSDESYRALLAALDLGWRVAQPVYLRSRWDGGSEKVYHFILTKSSTNKPTMITTRYTKEVERLVMEEGWQIT